MMETAKILRGFVFRIFSLPLLGYDLLKEIEKEQTHVTVAKLYRRKISFIENLIQISHLPFFIFTTTQQI